MSKLHNIVNAIHSSVRTAGNRPIAPWLDSVKDVKVYVKEVNPSGLTCLSVIAQLIPDSLSGHDGLAYLRSDEARQTIDKRLNRLGISISEKIRQEVISHYKLSETNDHPIRRERE